MQVEKRNDESILDENQDLQKTLKITHEGSYSHTSRQGTKEVKHSPWHKIRNVLMKLVYKVKLEDLVV